MHVNHLWIVFIQNAATDLQSNWTKDWKETETHHWLVGEFVRFCHFNSFFRVSYLYHDFWGFSPIPIQWSDYQIQRIFLLLLVWQINKYYMEHRTRANPVIIYWGLTFSTSQVLSVGHTSLQPITICQGGATLKSEIQLHIITNHITILTLISRNFGLVWRHLYDWGLAPIQSSVSWQLRSCSFSYNPQHEVKRE